MELALAREAYVEGTKRMSADLDLHRIVLQEQHQESRILKQILMSRGITLDKELYSQRAAVSMHSRHHPAFAGPGPLPHRQASSQRTVPPESPPSGDRMMSERGFPIGVLGSMPGSHSSHTPRTHTANTKLSTYNRVCDEKRVGPGVGHTQ